MPSAYCSMVLRLEMMIALEKRANADAKSREGVVRDILGAALGVKPRIWAQRPWRPRFEHPEPKKPAARPRRPVISLRAGSARRRK